MVSKDFANRQKSLFKVKIHAAEKLFLTGFVSYKG